MMLRLDVLPACHGDSLVVTYGSERSPHRILIDGGPANSYDTGLGPFLAALPSKQRTFALMIVSHVDTDHIDGAICALNDTSLGLRFKDIWFNRWAELSSGLDDRGALQGEYFTELLTKYRVNSAFGGHAVRRDLDRYIALPGGARLIVVSPSTEDLRVLRREWAVTCRAAGFEPGASAAIAARLDTRASYHQVALDSARDASRTPRFGADTTAANGSSIGIIFEYRGRRLLLSGDAHADTLTESFRELNRRWGTRRVQLDAFKLAHHGSAANITADLLDQLDCREFIISTDGSHFDHPDSATVELIGSTSRANPTILFNYASRAPDARQQVDWKVQVQVGDDGHLTMEWPIR